MTKRNGLGDYLFLDGVDLSGDIGSIKSIAGPLTPLGVTGINKEAVERIGGSRDGSLAFTAWFNSAGSMASFRNVPTYSRVATYLRGYGVGVESACMVHKQTTTDIKRGADGSLTLDISAAANQYGVEWGNSLTPGWRTDTAGTNGASLDGGAATSFGLQAYLQVNLFSGTDCTIKLQDSADDSTFTDITDGAFITVTAGAVTGRVQTGRASTVRRYIRVATTGTFTSCTFQVTVVRNQTTVNY